MTQHHLLLLIALLASTNIAASTVSLDSETLLEARVYLTAEDFQAARQKVMGVLQRDPESSEAQALMVEIIDREVQTSAEKEGISSRGMSRKDRELEISRWLERSRTFLALGYYDQALYCAEEVFRFEPAHGGASALVDQIYQRASKDEQKGMLLYQREAETESRERIEMYHKQARKWVEKGRWGAARLALDKIFLLSPSDAEAWRLKERIGRQGQG